MKAIAALIVLVIGACAVLASHQHKPFEMVIDEPDAKPATWPTNAVAPMGEAPANLLVTPCPLTPQNLPTRQTEIRA